MTPPELIAWYGALGLGLHEVYGMTEILFKSPGTMVGYYRGEAMTRELLDEDGFLHIGDRGEIDDQGRLRITGRVKELFKTNKGKYVAPAPIENRLLAHEELEQACVSGSGLPQPYALVVLAEHLRKSAKEHRAGLTAALEGHLAALNRELDPHEWLEKLIVVVGEWTVDNGLLTPTMKVKRTAIEEHYAGEIAGWYARSERIVWA